MPLANPVNLTDSKPFPISREIGLILKGDTMNVELESRPKAKITASQKISAF
jgi:hypothetical protein